MKKYNKKIKNVSDFLPRLSIFDLRKKGFLIDGIRSGTLTWNQGNDRIEFVVSISHVRDSYLEFIYSKKDNKEVITDYKYKSEIEKTKCHFGKCRFWFKCPKCSKRIGLLYMLNYYFKCRHCHNLTYSSRNMNRHSKSYHLFRMLELLERHDRHSQKNSKSYYRDKPTKKQLQKEKAIQLITDNRPSWLNELRRP